MKRTLALAGLALAGLAAAVVTCGLAPHASATTLEGKRHMVCALETDTQEGYCVSIVLPAQPNN